MYTIRHLHKKKGFTIVELVVVMAVIGVLAAILVPVLLGVTIRANIGSANSTASEIKKQIGYFLTMTDADHKNYMLMSDGCREAFTFTVKDGNWHIDAAQNPSAFSPDTVTWGNAADVDESTTTTSSQYGEELLSRAQRRCNKSKLHKRRMRVGVVYARYDRYIGYIRCSAVRYNCRLGR